MQTTLLSLAIAAILALLAALIGPHFVDWNAHRARFEQQASQLLGLPVRVGGNMDVRLLPSPTLLLGDIEIGRADDPQAFRARRLGIEFALPPLFSGKLRAVETIVSGPKLRVALDGNGRAQMPTALAGLNVEALSIDKLTVEDAQVELSDAASGRRLVLGKLWFAGEVRALPGPFRGEGAFVLDGGLYGYRITSARPESGGARIKFSLDPSDRAISAEADGLLSLEQGVPRFEGSAALVQRTAKGVEESWRVAARVQANPASALFEQIDIQVGPEERALKLTGTAEAVFGAQPRLNAVLTARTIDADRMLARDGAKVSPRQAVNAFLSATANAAPAPIPVQLGFAIDSLTLGGGKVHSLRGDIELNRDGATLTSLELRAPGFAQLQASGRLQHRGEGAVFEGPVEVSAVDPRALAEWLEGTPAPTALPARPVRLRGDLRADPASLSIKQMQAEIDGRTLVGDFSYQGAGAAGGARLQADLRAEELDLDSLLQAAGPAQSWIATQRPEKVALALSLKRLRFSGRQADDIDVKFALDRDVLNLDRLAIRDLDGLTLQGKGRIDLQGAPRGTLALDLDIRRSEGLANLIRQLSPDEPGLLARLLDIAAPGRISGNLAVAPAGRDGLTLATLTLAGPLGPMRLDLTSSLEGQWSDPAAAQLSLQAALGAGDINTLLKLAGVDDVLSFPSRSGSLTVSARGKAGSGLAVSGALIGDRIDARISGTARLWGEAAPVVNLDVVIDKTDVALAKAAPIPVTLRASAQVDASGLKLEKLSGSLAGSAVSGRLHFGKGKPSVIDGRLQSETLDLPALLAMLGMAAAESGSGWSEAPFVSSAIPPLAGNLDLTVKRLQLLPALRAGDLRLLLDFDGPEISASSLEAAVAGGRAQGQFTLRRGADGLAVQARLKLDNADAAQLLAAGSPALGGRAGVDLKIEGSGLSPRALVGSLNGGGSITLSPLRVSALDPKAFAAAMRAIDQGLPLDAERIREVVTRALEAGSLSLDKASGSISIAAGVVRVESFGAGTENADLTVSGSYNVPQLALDLRLHLLGQPTVTVPARPELSVLLRGPLSAPQRTIDVSALTGWLALRSVEEHTRRIEAIQRERSADPPKSQDKPEETDKRPDNPEPPAVIPRRRPPAPVAAPRPAQPAAPRTELKPLPPPIDIKPLPIDRRRVFPRFDNALPRVSD